ncbi:MAG: hypothetical protein HY904_12440 [Deltaproteobacteria bacterium]|nr:hypothetical protein [Deltaproteobacteria bacterium]
MPPTWGLQLVGVAVDREAQRVATIRQGDQRNALSAVRRVGDKLLGRVEVVAIGWRSILVRADGNLFMLGLKGRPHRDWTDVLRRWRTCSETDAGPR